MRNLSEYEREDYYKPLRVGNFWSNVYIKYTNKGNRKMQSVEEYVHKIRPYLRDIVNNLKKSDTWENLINNSNYLNFS